MGDMMTFPASVEEFMEQYKMTGETSVGWWRGGVEDRPGMEEECER